MFYYRILRKSKMLFQQPPWTPWEDAAYRFLGKLHVLRTPLQKTIFTKLTNRREALSKAKESYYLLRLAEPKDKFDPKQSGWERYYTLLVWELALHSIYSRITDLSIIGESQQESVSVVVIIQVSVCLSVRVCVCMCVCHLL
eukprot:GHVQ01030411.1.p1 GENE.GHVQ01030411.1~~GHVQ01030411.1.p1  ORF type:complete len:142 (+),score=14.06 GHVQ01030411.1:527-952(+)